MQLVIENLNEGEISKALNSNFKMNAIILL